MIYTITFNPALDYVVKVNNFEIGKINRTEAENFYVGGKGLNVSRILNNLEIETTALGFIAGFIGRELEYQLDMQGIKSDFIHVQNGITRINVKVRNNKETAINGNGPQIQDEDINKLIEKINQFNKEDIVVLSGNIPKNVDEHVYEKICEKLKQKEIKFIVDCNKELLLNVLKYNPFLIKPNDEELKETLNRKFETITDIENATNELKKMGATNILVSMGEKGAFFNDENGKTYFSKAPEIDMVNSVGAGDSMVAGFIYGYLKNKNFSEGFTWGIAAGTATASSEDLATKEKVEEIYTKIKNTEK